MLKTYRVISLSLVMALFFAAPLLCIHPISSQIKKTQRIQSKKGKVVFKRTTCFPQIKTRNVSAAWARSIHVADPTKFQRENAGSVREWEQRLHEDYRTSCNAAAAEHIGRGIGETVSHTDL